MCQGTSRSLNGRTIEKPDEAVHDLHHTRRGDKKNGFGDLGLKTTSLGFLVWPQNWWLRFGDLGLKITVTVSWFGPQNQGERRFVGLSLKTERRMKKIWRHASTSGGLLRSEVCRARVSQFGLKTGGGAVADGARGIIMELLSR